MRTAPVATLGRGRRAVRGRGGGAAREAPARRSAGRHAAAQDRLGRRATTAASRARSRASSGRRSPRRSSRAVDDPLLDGRSRARPPLFGAYRVDDEGVPAQRVSLVEKGVLKSLLMSRTPRKEIEHSNGHARAARFAGPRAHVGTLVVTGAHGVSRAGAARRARQDRQGGRRHHLRRAPARRRLAAGQRGRGPLGDAQLRRRHHGPPPVRPLVVYRVAHGKETLVRGLTPREPAAALAQGRHRHGQRALRLQLPRRRRRLLRASRRPSSRRRCCSRTSTCGGRPASTASRPSIRRRWRRRRRPPPAAPAARPLLAWHGTLG